jgi:hypothetical protein
MITCISRYYSGSYPEFSIYSGNTGLNLPIKALCDDELLV